MPNAILNVGSTGGQINISTAAAPATPAVGVVTLYAGTDKALHALNSDGTDITIAAASAASPITVQQTCSLVSTAIGGTAASGVNCAVSIGNNAQLFAGATGSIVIGNTSNGGTGACNSVVIGNSAKTTACNSVVIGQAACSTNNSIVIGRCASASQGTGTTQQGGIVIGNGACLFGASTEQSMAIGQNACASGIDSGVGRNAIAVGPHTVANTTFGGVAVGVCTTVLDRGVAVGYVACANGAYSIALGWAARSVDNTDFSIAIGTNSCITTNTQCSNAIGSYSCIKSSNSNAIGLSSFVDSGSACSSILGICSTVFPGATGTIVLGNSSVGGTGACDSVVIGNSSCTVGKNSIVMGNNNKNPNQGCAIVIGSDINNTGLSGYFNLFVGNNITCVGSLNNSIAIGNTVNLGSSNDVGIVYIGTFGCPGRLSTGLGAVANPSGAQSTAISVQSCASGNISIAIGKETISSAEQALAIGYNACATANCAQAIGKSATASHTCSVALGAGVTTERTNTTHVNSLVAYGQAASKTNAIGSTGGSVTLDWDNSNIQTLTLTSSITTLTKSNPIDGAVYTLFLTQGASGGYTVAWGADVDWAGGTGPTLSTAAGAVDAVSLVYIAGVTGYYGNANLNFS